jgi:hypothetical protein
MEQETRTMAYREGCLEWTREQIRADCGHWIERGRTIRAAGKEVCSEQCARRAEDAAVV